MRWIDFGEANSNKCRISDERVVREVLEVLTVTEKIKGAP